MALGREQIIDAVKKLGWPSEQYLVYTGTVLAVHGIRPANDIDIVANSDLFSKLQKNQDWESAKPSETDTYFLERDDIEVASKLEWKDFEITLEDAKRNEDVIDGIPFMALSDVVKVKQAMGREKDKKDIKLIREYLAT